MSVVDKDHDAKARLIIQERQEMMCDVAEFRAAKAADDGERVSLEDLIAELDAPLGSG